jgi:hypothetical protein
VQFENDLNGAVDRLMRLRAGFLAARESRCRIQSCDVEPNLD